MKKIILLASIFLSLGLNAQLLDSACMTKLAEQKAINIWFHAPRLDLCSVTELVHTFMNPIQKDTTADSTTFGYIPVKSVDAYINSNFFQGTRFSVTGTFLKSGRYSDYDNTANFFQFGRSMPQEFYVQANQAHVRVYHTSTGANGAQIGTSGRILDLIDSTHTINAYGFNNINWDAQSAVNITSESGNTFINSSGADIIGANIINQAKVNETSGVSWFHASTSLTNKSPIIADTATNDFVTYAAHNITMTAANTYNGAATDVDFVAGRSHLYLNDAGVELQQYGNMDINSVHGNITVNVFNAFVVNQLSVFANNTAARVGGIPTNGLYLNVTLAGDTVVKVVH